MRWRRTAYSISVCLLAAVSLRAADTALPAYLPAGSRVVAGLRVRSLVDALAAQGFGKEMRDGVKAAMAQIPMAGFDPLQDLDEIVLATTGEGQNPPSLAVLTGRFNAAAFSGGARYGNALILDGPKGSRQTMALVDANTMLAGDASLVRAALDGKGATIAPALAARVAALRARYEIWGAGNPPPGVKLPANGAEQLEAIDRFDFGMSLAHGMECVADLHFRTPKDLEKLSSTLQLLSAMMKAQPAAGDQARFDLRTASGAIHVALSIPEEALKKAIAAQRATMLSALAAGMSAGAPKPPKPAPTDKMQVVRNDQGDMIMVTLPGK